VGARLLVVLLTAWLLLSTAGAAFAQTAGDEDFHVYTDSPRLLLTRARLRLLQRERERQSMRWEQFDALIRGGAPMPEPGFALALYSQIARDPSAAKKAIDWALGDTTDLRQLALVFDWCGPMLNPAQAERLAAKIQQALAVPSSDVRRQSARVLAAIALADRLPDQGEALLKPLVLEWWRSGIAPRLEKGQPAIPREQIYFLYEMMHALRDNLKIDLRDSAPEYFKDLPTDHLAGHYPASLQTPENEYRVPVYARDGNPDVTDAILSRAAELAMVAYDGNALDSQYLQGWLMQDRFLMRGAMGIVYEFLWANPYQPGLSYFQLPLIFRNSITGHVFARTSWDENATWLGYFDGHLQLFRDGQIESLRAGAKIKPLQAAGALVLSADRPEALKFRANAEAVFVLNLTPRTSYDVEVDDEEMWDAETDSGGTLLLSFPENTDTGVRIHRH
jgi:hypothetical protein